MSESSDVQKSVERMQIHMELRGLRPTTTYTFANCARRFLAYVGKPPTAVQRPGTQLTRESAWLLVEAKTSDTKLSPALAYYHQKLRTEHAFQLVKDLPFEPADCFARHDPVVAPARTLLSQLF